MSDDRRFDPRFDPAFQPGYEGPLSEATPPVVSPQPVIGSPPRARQAAASLLAPTATPIEDDPAPRRANPFLIALAVVAVLLIGGGGYLLSRIREFTLDSGSITGIDYMTLQALVYAAPLAVALGVATGIGVLFIYAVRWGRR